ncbi:MAG: TraB/GumN family protein [Pseudomonadota bacterium]
MKSPQLLTSTAAAFALFASAPALADGHNEAAQATSETSGPALWKVADEDTTIYLFGTVHMLPSDVDWNSGAVNEALASAQTLVTELNLTPETEPQIATSFQKAGLFADGNTLRSLMDDEQRATFEGGLAKIGVEPEVFDPMEPWFASIVLFQIVATASGFTPDKGVEKVLEGLVGPDTERVALETIDQQIRVLDELPMDQQLIYLLEFAADPLEGIKGLNDIIAVWTKGDAEGVGQMVTEAVSGHPLLAERLFYSRNSTWAKWIEMRLDTTPGTVFIAVGAGHLAGERSVQDMLSKRDIEVERVQ